MGISSYNHPLQIQVGILSSRHRRNFENKRKPCRRKREATRRGHPAATECSSKNKLQLRKPGISINKCKKKNSSLCDCDLFRIYNILMIDNFKCFIILLVYTL